MLLWNFSHSVVAGPVLKSRNHHIFTFHHLYLPMTKSFPLPINLTINFCVVDLEGLENRDIDYGKVNNLVFRGIVFLFIEEKGGGH